jgi:exosortase A-associated hydrolase 1
MTFTEHAAIFSCVGDQLLCIIAVPELPQATGILIVVGGPQYRVGSHRQFLLLSRALARAGYPAMRFDFRGMGDSTGEFRNFETINDDIAAAIDAFQANCPQVERIVLWGLCDAASANLLFWYQAKDARVHGIVLLNPWVRSEATLARTHIKHYYSQRLFQAEFWRKLMTGKLGLGRAISGFLGNLKQARKESLPAGRNETLTFQKKWRTQREHFMEKCCCCLVEAITPPKNLSRLFKQTTYGLLPWEDPTSLRSKFRKQTIRFRRMYGGRKLRTSPCNGCKRRSIDETLY